VNGDGKPDGYQSVDGEIVANHDEIASADGTDSVALARRRSLSLKASAFSGPLPPPELFAQYESACPGAASRILAMAEDEGQHRRAIERQSVEAAIATEKRGQFFGYTLVLSFLFVGSGLLLLGVPGVGVAAVITAIGSVVASALWSKYSEYKELKAEKAQRKKAEADERAAAEKAANDAKKAAARQKKKDGSKK
jgi:uncharacterized membrane protein